MQQALSLTQPYLNSCWLPFLTRLFCKPRALRSGKDPSNSTLSDSSLLGRLGNLQHARKSSSLGSHSHALAQVTATLSSLVTRHSLENASILFPLISFYCIISITLDIQSGVMRGTRRKSRPWLSKILSN